MPATAEESIRIAHEQIWTRFIRQPYGIFLDYIDDHGHTIIPTPDECKRAMPNAMSWYTSIENGAFFTGFYLSGLINDYKLYPSENIEKEISKLIQGLFLLQDVGTKPGFIARNVSTDGVSHYPGSSDDQVGPWLYGLWKVLDSDYPSSELRFEIKKRMMVVIEAIDKAGWRIPSEWEGVAFGNFIRGNFREAARLLFFCRIAAEISDSQYWLERYHELMYEKPEGGIRTRLEICRDGFALHMVENPSLNGQFWINLGAQAALYELCVLEKDKDIIDHYMHGLYINGITVLPLLTQYTSYANDDHSLFDIDWRQLEKFWKPHKTVEDARCIAKIQSDFWVKEIVPRRKIEHNLLTQILYANWIAQMSKNNEIKIRADEALKGLLLYIDWTTLHLPCAYVAECAWYESLLHLNYSL